MPTGQGYELFRGLKDRGKTTELVFYPREGHGIAEYYHLRDRLTRINDVGHALHAGIGKDHDSMTSSITGTKVPSAGAGSFDAELLATLFELGREISSFLDLEELLAKIPQLIARVTPFTVFSVYLVDERRGDLKIAYAVGYPDEVVRNFRLQMGQGIVGAAVAEQRPILVGDVAIDPRYVSVVEGIHSNLAVPLRPQGQDARRAEPSVGSA